MTMNSRESCPIRSFGKLLLATQNMHLDEGAIREAIMLAKICSGRLYAISVVETNPEFEVYAPQLAEKEDIRTREHLEAVRAMAAKEGVDCEIIARRGQEAYEFIVDEAEAKKADMIVMGRKSKSGLQRLMMGSVTAKVIGHAPCNILVVPDKASVEYKKILVATDGSKYSETAAAQAVTIAKQCGGSLIVISVVPSESESPLDIVRLEMRKDIIADKELKASECSIKNVREVSEKHGVTVEGLIMSGSPYEAIVSVAKEKDVDLIVVGSHGKTGLDRLIMGSVAERVIMLSPCAVLVVKK